MTAEGRTLLNKALFRLDRGDVAGAEAVLRQAVAAAEESADPVDLVRALVVWGDCLHAEGRAAEGEVHLARALTVDLTDHEDVADDEIDRARELLGRR